MAFEAWLYYLSFAVVVILACFIENPRGNIAWSLLLTIITIAVLCVLAIIYCALNYGWAARGDMFMLGIILLISLCFLKDIKIT